MNKYLYTFALALAVGVSPVRAEVIEATPSGVQIKHVVVIAASVEKVYKTLLQVDRWWDSAHTYSGKSANLKLDARAGGCWCETLPGGGGVVHMTVVNLMPNKLVALSGGLGPLQSAGVAGAMSWQVADKDNGTEFTLSYSIGGYFPGGLDKVAAGVDGVLAEQVGRLKRVIETGNPSEPKKEAPPAK